MANYHKPMRVRVVGLNKEQQDYFFQRIIEERHFCKEVRSSSDREKTKETSKNESFHTKWRRTVKKTTRIRY